MNKLSYRHALPGTIISMERREDTKRSQSFLDFKESSKRVLKKAIESSENSQKLVMIKFLTRTLIHVHALHFCESENWTLRCTDGPYEYIWK